MKMIEEIRKLVFSFGYALRGTGYAVRTQRNLRIHLVALITVIVFNTIAELSAAHWCVEILCCMLVISLELVNTALECACNQISTEQRPLIGHAKDAAAGAVLVAASGSVVIALLIFFRGSEAYSLNTAAYFQKSAYAGYALLAGAVAALLFIFLPSILQTRKKQ